MSKIAQCIKCSRPLFCLKDGVRDYAHNITAGMIIENAEARIFYCSTDCLDKYKPKAELH